jgi:alkylhydroperoxidase/carboxymuconolactone decarboxylase family protein YurZ
MSGPADRTDLAEWLANVVAGDPLILASATCPVDDNIEESGLDVRTHAMVCLAALVAAGESGSAFDEHVAIALDHGVTLSEIAGVLVALLPTAGAARVASAAPAILAAIDRTAADVHARPEIRRDARPADSWLQQAELPGPADRLAPVRHR